jgi:hypothetical protein
VSADLPDDEHTTPLMRAAIESVKSGLSIEDECRELGIDFDDARDAAVMAATIFDADVAFVWGLLIGVRYEQAIRREVDRVDE